MSSSPAPVPVDGQVDRAVLLARAYLSRVAEPPAVALAAFVDEVGPVAAAHQVREGTTEGPGALPPGVARETSARRGTDRAEADLALIAARGGRLIVPEDPEWPALALMGLGHVAGADGAPGLEGPATHDGPAAPIALWARGPLRLDGVPTGWAAMVGARAATEYGLWVARDWSAELADRGCTVVSGAALGIDGAAHRGALAVGGDTVAVLACGIDRAYPPKHAALLEHVGHRGLVLTEYPPGATPARHRFLVRNRLIAALAAGTVVVEAAARSGAMRTALVAGALGRAVMVVPGPVTSVQSLGCHELARRPEVSVVGRVAHVVEEVSRVGDGWAPPPGTPTRRTDGLDPGALRMHEALPLRAARTAARLAHDAGVDFAEADTHLRDLETRGLVSEDDGRWRRRPG
ncbi:DNA-processing protein DprA [Actinomycetospora aeridis]|uniref:DNA-processing protein DprA n=1 Tax=Actinomycetospora aeridis TaxID=3129231 RepID=A0ABU8NCG8_9PSEU